MANANISDILATTISNRTRSIADNVTKNNAVLAALSTRGRIKTASGGTEIWQELSYQENQNTGWYSGYDLLPVGVSDVLTAAAFQWKQAAVPVIISGLELLRNSGREQMIDLMDARLEVAESSMMNLISLGIYSDGTAAGNKQITGLDVAVPNETAWVAAPTYGGINPNTWAFWRNQVEDKADTTTLLADWNQLWAKTTRGADRVDLIMCDNVVWTAYIGLLQAQQRFMQAEEGRYGFPSLRFQTAEVILDGGIGGGAQAGTAYFLNTNYIHYRPHRDRNMVPLSPNRRYATNQDAEVQILGWAGNLTCSGRQFQGRYDAN